MALSLTSSQAAEVRLKASHKPLPVPLTVQSRPVGTTIHVVPSRGTFAPAGRPWPQTQKQSAFHAAWHFFPFLPGHPFQGFCPVLYGNECEKNNYNTKYTVMLKSHMFLLKIFVIYQSTCIDILLFLLRKSVRMPMQ